MQTPVDHLCSTSLVGVITSVISVSSIENAPVTVSLHNAAGSQSKLPSSPITSALAALSEKNRLTMLGSNRCLQVAQHQRRTGSC